MNYADEILACVHDLGRVRVADVQNWFINGGKRPPATITISIYLAELLRVGKIERPSYGLYCAPGRSPTPPPVLEWAERVIRGVAPDYVDYGTLRSAYHEQHGVKLGKDVFRGALGRLLGQNKIVAHRDNRAFAWNQAYRP